MNWPYDDSASQTTLTKGLLGESLRNEEKHLHFEENFRFDERTNNNQNRTSQYNDKLAKILAIGRESVPQSNSDDQHKRSMTEPFQILEQKEFVFSIRENRRTVMTSFGAPFTIW